MIPHIIKEAISKEQVRHIKRLIPVLSRAGERTALSTELLTSAPISINIKKPLSDPLYSLMHEFGHNINNVKNRGVEMSGPIDEVMANRFAARYLLHTGSPMSEVKDYVRGVKKHLDTYTVDGDREFIKKMYEAMPDKMNTLVDKWNRTVDKLDMGDYTAISGLRKDVDAVATENMIDLNKMYPWRKAKTSIDLSPTGREAASIKTREREAFRKYVRDAQIPRVLPPSKTIIA